MEESPALRIAGPGEDRTTFIGGSDIPNLVQLEPWGCRRRLAYDKLGIPADFPFTGNSHTKRGQKLEAVAVDEYCEQTGRIARRMAYRENREKPWLGVHLDRMLHDPKRFREPLAGSICPGVLEVKVPARESFYRIKAHLDRTGDMPMSFQVQLQWGLALTGWKWGSIAVFHADSWSLLYKDYDRDGELCELLLREADDFFKTIQNISSTDVDEVQFDRPINMPDKRCLSCPWRKRCQGIGEVPGEIANQEQIPDDAPVETDLSLSSLVSRYLELAAVAREANEVFEETKAELKEKMGDRRAVDAGSGEVFVTNVQIKERVTKAHVQRRIRVKPKT